MSTSVECPGCGSGAKDNTTGSKRFGHLFTDDEFERVLSPSIMQVIHKDQSPDWAVFGVVVQHSCDHPFEKASHRTWRCQCGDWLWVDGEWFKRSAP